MKNLTKCAVCGDVASGIHYNIPSCFGCKTFFRRAIIKSRRFYCEHDNNCDVRQRSGRRSCRACRLRRCLDVGMDTAALQPKRDHNYTADRELATMVAASTSAGCGAPASAKCGAAEPAVNAALLELITDLTRTDQELRERKRQRLRSVTEAMKLTREVNDVTCPEYYGRSDLRIVEKLDMASVTSGELYSLLEWAGTLPFFRRLPLKTRMEMLQKFAVYQTIIEQGAITAQSGLNNLWLLPNGSCLPKEMDALPITSQVIVSEDRAWRQNKLYRQMTERCIEDVAMPMRRLQLLPQELVTLKVIMLCQCGMQGNERTTESLVMLKTFKDQIITALFEFYRSTKLADYEERFGNILLLISGIVSAEVPTHESFRIQSLFGFVQFDRMTNTLLFPRESDAISVM